MDFTLLKNPIILAIIAATGTYLYMYWENKKKHDNNPKIEMQEVSYITPAIVGFVTLLIAYGLFGFGSKKDIVGDVIAQTSNVKILDNSKSCLIKGSRMSERLTDTFDSNTYHLIGKNVIKIPQTDVFIDIAKF